MWTCIPLQSSLVTTTRFAPLAGSTTTLSVASARTPSTQARNLFDVAAPISSLPLSHRRSLSKDEEAEAVVTARKSLWSSDTESDEFMGVLY